ncbi:squalene/phytoene synthase family protein [Candidatus Liberibacter asiaticus]
MVLKFLTKNTRKEEKIFSRDSLFVLRNLRDIDYDRYLACLLSPPLYRISLSFLYYFHTELMRVRDTARNPITRDMRLQWWKDIFESSTKGLIAESISPFSVELLSIVRQYDLPNQYFLDMIEAHFFDSYNDSIFDCKQFVHYAFRISSRLIHLATMILDSERYSASLRVIKYAGIAQFIGQLICQLPIHYHRGQLYFPLDILGAVGLDRESFLSGQNSDRISLAIKIFAELGLKYLFKAREEMRYILPDVFPAFIPVSITESVLKHAQNHGFKIVSHSHTPNQLVRPWYMLSSSIKKRF